MANRFDLSRLSAAHQAEAQAQLAAQSKDLGKDIRQQKYNAKRTPGPNGKIYPSALQARAAFALFAKHGADNVFEEVTLHFGGNTMRLDFMPVLEKFPDGSFRVKLVDAKGKRMADWEAKRNHLADKRGIRIEVMTDKDLK